MTSGTLFIIATPLGNLGDITLRALETLKTLNVFFAEDSRELIKLLDAYHVPRADKRVHSYSNHNMKEATQKALELLREGQSIGFASDRGTPGISDPGALLVQGARAEGITVLPVPGVSAVTSLLSVSGFRTDEFHFLGFPSLGKKEREASWDWVAKNDLPVCFLESPKRIRETLAELEIRFPNGEVCVGREMTKLYETYSKFPLSHLKGQDVPERGEFTIVLQPNVGASQDPEGWREEVRLRLLADKAWAKEIAARFDVGASLIYNALQQVKNESK